MYSIRIFDGPDDTEGALLSSPYINELKVKYSMNLLKHGISNVTIQIPRNNPKWQSIRPLKTLVEITNIRTFKVVFRGRFLRPRQNYDASGLTYLTYDCEDKKAYFNDSNQRWRLLQDISIRDGLGQVLDVHNQQVEPHKRFILGNVTVTNNTDNLYRFVGYGKTLDEIYDNFVERLGGYLSIREEEDGTYLDYLADEPELKDTPIRIRGNLKQFRRELDPTEIVTRVIPLGARIEAAEDEESYVSMPRIDASSVNDGKDYFDNLELIEEFGIIEGTIEFDDINEPQFLPLRADQFFQSQKAAKVSYQLSVLQTYLIDKDVDELEVGYRYPISTYPAFNIEEDLEIIGMKINSENPQLPDMTIGEQFRSLSQYQSEMNRKTQKLSEIENNIIAQQRALQETKRELNSQIGNLQTALENIDTSEIPELQEAIENLLDSVSDLADLVDSIEIPGLATEIDAGLMSSADKRKLNRLTLEVSTNLDDLRTKLELITVTQEIDLDQLYLDVEELKNVEE
ncbi:MAG: phage tail protein [Alkalibacterium sp.]|nr:phage tail protein [Alkalibacterium sp.]